MTDTSPNDDLVTFEKAEWIEQQSLAMFDFVTESRRLLSRDAVTTLNWLFAGIAASCGYLLTVLNSDPVRLWVIAPLIVVSAVFVPAAWQLIHGAMMTESIRPRGNQQSPRCGRRWLQRLEGWSRCCCEPEFFTSALRYEMKKAAPENGRGQKQLRSVVAKYQFATNACRRSPIPAPPNGSCEHSKHV